MSISRFITAILVCFAVIAPMCAQAQTIKKLSLSPSTVVGGNSATGTVTLSKKASGQGSAVSLTSSNVSVTVPGSVTVPSGANTATFTVTTVPVAANTSAKITAKLGSSSSSATLQVTAPKLILFTLNPTAVTGGAASTGTITISSGAPKGGLSVALSSSNAAWGGPPSLTISTGATTGTFQCATKGVSAKVTAKITAKLGSVSKTASLTINPATIQTLSISPPTVTGGDGATATVTLNGYAPVAGATITVTCNQPTVTVPKTVTIPYGSAQTQFKIATSVVTHSLTAIVTGTLAKVKTSGTLSVVPVNLSSFSINPTSILGGSTATGLVSLSDVAQTNVTILLKSNNAAATVPASVSVATGSASATFTIDSSAVASSTPVNITASMGATSLVAMLTLTPATVSGVSISPTTVIGGQPSQGTVTISGAAPGGGTSVMLSCLSSAVSVPSTVTVAAGQTSATFSIGTLPVATQVSAQITATLGSSAIGVNLTVTPAVLTSFAISPTSVIGGQSAQGTLTLNGLAPSGGTAITLSSSAGAVTVPGTVTVAVGQASVVFTVTTVAVGQPVTATINAVDPYGNQMSATLALTATQVITVPVAVNAIVFDPVSGNLWATTQQSDPNNPSAVIAINPQTGIVGKTISIGAEPNHISVTSDGAFAYVDVPSDGTVRRVDLNAGTIAATYQLGATGLFDLKAVPGSPHAFVTVTDPVYGVNTHVYDDGVVRSGTGAGGYFIIFGGDGSTIYGNGQTSLFYDTLSTDQINWTNQITFNIGVTMAFAKGLLFTGNGPVIDPVKQSIVQTLTSPNFLSSLGVAASAADNRVYYVAWDVTHSKRIVSFDMTSYQEYPFTDTGILTGGANMLTACGNHTAAFFLFGDGVTHNVVLVHGLN